MNKKILFAAAAALLLGAFSAKTYMDIKSPVDAEYSILTAEQDIPSSDMDGAVMIEDGAVPLAGGPGEPSSEAPADGPQEGSGTIVAAAAAPVQADPNEHPNIQKIVDLVNAERSKAGLAPLTKDPTLCRAAAVRAQELTSSFSHSRPDGSSYKTALAEAGAAYRGAGENVAYGYRTPDSVMSAWMGSEGHRSNIMNEKFTSIGVGFYRGSNGYYYWSQMFTY